jgi:lysophospholipase L1-like esterase
MQKIISFGASTAYGARDYEKGGFLLRIVAAMSPAGEYEAVNFGKIGDSTRDMLVRLKTLAIPDGATVIITLGINDVQRIGEDKHEKRVPLEEHRSNLAAILDFLNARARPLYMSQYPVAYEQCSLSGALVERYVHAGMDVAGQAGVPVVDIYSAVHASGRYSEMMFKDGLHFNNYGHQFMADQTIEFFNNNRWFEGKTA